ncbi:hypothetical protein T07_3125 [Trichinella nelsoni]|uniref:Uncharacterized protein n=1 Tax=Trichinella nelsoni TaxID=6336 RepID=A0A0V0RT02_9BILA|nr:hypothetical protein T07_3125 [Trichinella nelsoni]
METILLLYYKNESQVQMLLESATFLGYFPLFELPYYRKEGEQINQNFHLVNFACQMAQQHIQVTEAGLYDCLRSVCHLCKLAHLKINFILAVRQ